MFKTLLILLFFVYFFSVLGYLLNLFIPRLWFVKCSLLLVSSGVVLQTALLGWRWWEAGYLPVTNLFSTLFFFSWSLALIYLYFELRYRIRATGLFVMLMNLILLGSAIPREAQVAPLIPSLDTPLFTLHILFSFAGYAFFAMAFSIGVLYLIQNKRQTTHLPDKNLLKRINEEAIFLGFGLFTICMITGSIWAYIAWGYWFSWNIKSIWSCLVWIFYAGMCHAKFIRRWQGSVYAWLSIAGFAVVLFTYLGIGLLLESNHPLE
ncbi:MAG: cytochrome c biogenesis protein CcsA [Deltaproteobacteria bacterium]|jgi:cytochrome c-type biogenesis protein CcsB|nr:cytochrome c biogenesis protein CcsA [Deltaproteobacteria bacterium]MBW2503893.1 cytochrome c biogenesis protein CcsA [Deltaproteobacteria bacterium]MBW2520894.1 cytochrome c biogenesis protein CcsA [Deltaproteobacteria bacterium]